MVQAWNGDWETMEEMIASHEKFSCRKCWIQHIFVYSVNRSLVAREWHIYIYVYNLQRPVPTEIINNTRAGFEGKIWERGYWGQIIVFRQKRPEP